MGTGILAVCLCLTLGQAPSNMFHSNARNLMVPVNIPAALQPEVRELLLYASTNQGREWKQVAGPISSDKKGFAFYAPADGIYWLRVVKISKQGVQEPDDKSLMSGPPDMQLSIDTLKPIVRSIQAIRYDDTVQVTWDVQESNPNLTPEGMGLEYQVKDAGDTWKSLPITPGLSGKTQFTPGHRQPLVVRLTVSDMAKNQSYGMAEVAGAVSTTGFTKAGSSPVLPGQLELPDRKVQPMDIGKLELPPLGPDKNLPPLKKEDGGLKGGLLNPPPPNVGVLPSPNGGVLPPPNVGVLPPPMGLNDPPKTNVAPQVPIEKEHPGEKVVADSRFPPPPPVQKTAARETPGGIVPPVNEKSIASTVPSRKPLPALQYINQHQVLLEYELRRVGPSGIGGIELWLTRDDGETWEPYAADEDVQGSAVNNRQKRKFDLRDASDRPFADGIYGLTLVVKNRAGLGKKPRPGDVPEIRVEIDTTLPFAQMFQPVADPQHPDQVLLKWSAEDKNLSAAPISLEFAEKADGAWLPIASDIENSGRFSWKVGPGVPVQVFLRMRVRDKAGNERVLVTPQAQFIDFTEPEGALIGVQTPGRP